MSAIIDITGQRFGRLVVQARAANAARTRQAYWAVLCDCGETRVVMSYTLRNGATRSCGCLKAETSAVLARNLAVANTKHGMHHSRTASCWQAMKQRCTNPNCQEFKNYGARGISFDPRWELFENFLADMGEKPAGKSIGRRDNALGYSASNCQWETLLEQNNNTRANRFLEHDGKRLTIAQWSRELGFGRHVIPKRLTLGWPISKVITTPVGSPHGGMR